MLRMHKAGRAAALATRNRACRSDAVDSDGGPPVSLTSHGRRIRTVHLAIESIAAGTLRPSRLILWLDDADAVACPTPGLRRLIRRGLEVRHTVGYRPHTKYYPYVQSRDVHEVPLVTADDDLMYPPEWLARLMRTHALDPGTNTAHRSREVSFVGDRLAPYSSWPEVARGPASARNLATGTWGHVMTPAMLEALRDRHDEFMRRSPAADDLWLHRVAVETGTAAKVTGAFSNEDFLHLPDGGETLAASNVEGAGNDRQIACSWPAAMTTTMFASPKPANTLR
jgi:hypothetical protein